MDVDFPGQVARFKIFPHYRKPYYWTVLVFANRGYMRRAFHQLNVNKNDTDDRFDAIVMPQEGQRLIRGEWKSKPSLGYALFARNRIGAETLCHEAIHMAIEYLRRTNSNIHLDKEYNDADENICYHAGWCARKLNRDFWKFNCYPE